MATLVTADLQNIAREKYGCSGTVWHVKSNGVSWVQMNNQGSGYTSAPTVTATGGGGTGAVLIATVSLGRVTVFVLNPGYGYTSAPSIGFSGGGGSGAVATAHMSITSNLPSDTNDGLSWDTAFYSFDHIINTVGLEGDMVLLGAGTFAPAGFQDCPYGMNIVGQGMGVSRLISATASYRMGGCELRDLTIGDSNVSGFDLAIEPLSGASITMRRVHVIGVSDCLYTTVPAQFRLYDCRLDSLWDLIAVQNVVNGVAAITVVSGGNSYTGTPTVNIDAPPAGGVQATATATVSGNAVTAITVTNAGSGYTTTPNITITGGGGSAATAYATMTGIVDIELDRCVLNARGKMIPSAEVDPTYSNGINVLASSGTRITLKNCYHESSGDGVSNIAAHIDSGRLDVIGGACNVFGSTTLVNFKQSGNGVINLHGVAHDQTLSSNSGTGSINRLGPLQPNSINRTLAVDGSGNVTATIPANGINASQSFNNAGQTSAVPAFGIPMISGTVPSGDSPPLADSALPFPINYPWRQSFSVSNIDASAWTQIVFTVKASTDDLDTAAKIAVVKSNPGVGTDGLILLNGAAPSGGTTAADGTITVASATTTGFTIAVSLTARGTAIAKGNYVAEVTLYTSAGKSTWFGTMRLEADPTVRTNPTTS